MSFAFPLTAAQFMDKICPVLRVRFFLDEPMSVSQLGDGTVLRASRGAALWQGDFIIRPRVHREAAEIEALLSLLLRPGASFLAYDPRRNGPSAGAGIGDPTIGFISGDRREMSLSGWAGTITPGDMLGFTYGSSPLRYALHRAVAGATDAGTFEVTPPLRPAVTTGAAVNLMRPVCKATLLADGTMGAGGVRFSEAIRVPWVQTLG